MAPKISVIMPLYNVEQYVGKCLDSIFAQTFQDFELIVVNDGSTDHSLEVVEGYQKDHEIQIITIQNSGVSVARNVGIDNAKGDYIYFIDSDDYIDPTMLEKLYNKATTEGCDVVVCDYYKVTKQETVVVSSDLKDDMAELEFITKAKTYIWNKLFSRAHVLNLGIKFPVGCISQDMYFAHISVMLANKVGYVHEPLYYYVFDREGSTVNKKLRKIHQVLIVLKEFNEYFKQHGLFEKYYATLCDITVKHVYFHLKNPQLRNHPRKYRLQYVKDGFALMDGYFPDWRNVSTIAKKFKNRSKTKIYWLVSMVK